VSTLTPDALGRAQRTLTSLAPTPDQESIILGSGDMRRETSTIPCSVTSLSERVSSRICRIANWS
jgi:hypothetical protein